MLGFLVYGLTAPLYYGAKAASRAGRRSRSYRPRAPRYTHGYCTVAHRSEGAAQRCAMTAAYRRVEAAAIAAERQRAWEAAQREGERRIAAAMKGARRQRLARERKAKWQRRREVAVANLKWVWIACAAMIVVVVALVVGAVQLVARSGPATGPAWGGAVLVVVAAVIVWTLLWLLDRGSAALSRRLRSDVRHRHHRGVSDERYWSRLSKNLD